MTSQKSKIAIFASGNGSNAINIIKYFNSVSSDQFTIGLLYSDKENAPVLGKAQNEGIECFCIPKGKLNKYAYERKVVDLLLSQNIDWIFLAGFMRILSSNFLKNFYDERGFNRVINIHPSLLPKYKGLNAYEKAYVANEIINGATIHFVDDQVDNGQIILQKSFERNANHTLEDFKSHGLENEHLLFKQFLNYFLNKKIKLEHNKVVWE